VFVGLIRENVAHTISCCQQACAFILPVPTKNRIAAVTLKHLECQPLESRILLVGKQHTAIIHWCCLFILAIRAGAVWVIGIVNSYSILPHFLGEWFPLKCCLALLPWCYGNHIVSFSNLLFVSAQSA